MSSTCSFTPGSCTRFKCPSRIPRPVPAARPPALPLSPPSPAPREGGAAGPDDDDCAAFVDASEGTRELWAKIRKPRKERVKTPRRISRGLKMQRCRRRRAGFRGLCIGRGTEGKGGRAPGLGLEQKELVVAGWSIPRALRVVTCVKCVARQTERKMVLYGGQQSWVFCKIGLTLRLFSQYASFAPHAVLFYSISPDRNHQHPFNPALHTKQPNSFGVFRRTPSQL